MNNYKTPLPRRMSRKQSDAEPPSQQMVSVAVLPPRLPKGMAPPTGITASGAVGFDEAINYQHNEDAVAKPVSKSKQFLRSAGITTTRQRNNPDLPPFTFRQVPYDTWRKHYAKDADGNYRGTHAPAEDCLLKPDDVKKWRFDEEPTTQADRWTRGSEVLPVYSEVEGHGRVPGYEQDYDYTGVPAGEPTIGSNSLSAPAAESHRRSTDAQSGRVIADGKTAQQIIDEAKAKGRPKQSWKDILKKGGSLAMQGGG